MSVLSRPLPPLTSAQSHRHCSHCGALLGGGQDRFCCPGCAAAYTLVSGLGLQSFYARRQTPLGVLRPETAPLTIDFTPHVVISEGGECRIDFLVAGLSCGACVWLVEQALAAEADVMAARAALTTRRLTITWRGEASRANDFAALIARLGFRPAPWSPACLAASEDAESRTLLRALGIAAFGAMNVMLVSIPVWVGSDMGEATRHALHWLAALIGLPVVLVAGLPFYRSAGRGLMARRPNMDLAISLGVLLTAAMSLSETIRNGPYTYFDGATALLALLLAGRVIDRAARRRARQAVAELLALQEGPVTRLDRTGRAEVVPAETVAAGERVVIASGERLRLDGYSASETLLDTAARTGESLPRRFPAGAALPAGAVNMGPPFVLTVTAAARDGSLAAMARLLAQAEQAKSHFITIADQAARWYVPVAHAVAAATFLLWWGGLGAAWQVALVHAVCVLLITCPCALALAVPAVQVVAVGALFRRGVLIAAPTALERLAGADYVVLDKTGTLTEGRPVFLPEGQDPALLRRAASLARASRHPLARAMVAAVPDAPWCEGVQEVPGQGLVAGTARLGSPAFCGVAAGGEGMLLCYREGEGPPVLLRFADRLREDAPEAVRALHALGLEVELLSGDGGEAVAALAREVGIATWQAGADPQAKLARITALKAVGRRPLMVGDGINDAAALAAAHVSAAPAEATDLAQSAADLVLQRASLATLPAALRIARRAQALARQNIAFSFAYNVLAVPVAVAGLVTPLIAALVMASSSLIVIGNALRAGQE